MIFKEHYVNSKGQLDPQSLSLPSLLAWTLPSPAVMQPCPRSRSPGLQHYSELGWCLREEEAVRDWGSSDKQKRKRQRGGDVARPAKAKADM